MPGTEIERHRGDWVELLGPAHQLAQAIAKTEFVPTALRNKPEAVMAAILAGEEMGVPPMQALSKIHIVEGRPAPAAELMRAMAMSRGHEIWVEATSNTAVTICGQRDGSEHVTKATWTIEDAKRAGLAGKQVWQKYPRAMLLARATAELCRLVFPDVLGGMSYAKEELEDGFIDGEYLGEEQPADLAAAGVPAPQPATRTRQRARKATKPAAADAPRADQPAATVPQPPLPGEEDDEPVPGNAVASLPNDQAVAMWARDASEKLGWKLDHHIVVKAVTSGVQESAKGLDADQVAAVKEAIVGIFDGTKVLTLTDADVPAVVDFDEALDRLVTDDERAEVKVWLDKLAPEQLAEMKGPLTGVVPNYAAPKSRFTLRHLQVVADRIERYLPVDGDSDVAEPDEEYAANEEPFA